MPLPRGWAEWVGLSSGMAFALTNVLTRRAHALPLPTKSLAVWLGVTLFSLLFMLPAGHALADFSRVGAAEWGLMGLIGLVLMLTTLLVQYGLTHTSAVRASIIFLFEIVVAAASAYWLVGEALGLREWVGGAMIIAATFCAPKS